MAKLTFKQRFLKHADKFQDCEGAYQFTMNDTDFMLDQTYSGRTLLWFNGNELLAFSDEQDYEALADMAEFEATGTLHKEAAE